MGRGGGGGGHSSGGSHSHSSSRSHGSSHSHSSSGGRSHSSSGGYHSSHSGGYHSLSYHHNDYHHHHHHYGGGYHSTTYVNTGRYSVFSSVLTLLIIFFIMAVVMISLKNSYAPSRITASTTQRERVETKNAYINDCIEDEIGWIDNEKKMASNLKYFYEKTGCQPYIVLREYDPSMNSDSAREIWSQNYYDTNFAENQNVVLYVYFCDEYDEGEGNDTLFVGTESGIVMDAEAQEIFWNYLDYDWDSWDVNDNDGMFVDVFKKTADRIMTVTTTTKDVQKNLILAVIVIVLVTGGIIVITKKFKRDKEKAQETIDILNSPLNGPSDDLADKYLK